MITLQPSLRRCWVSLEQTGWCAPNMVHIWPLLAQPNEFLFHLNSAFSSISSVEIVLRVCSSVDNSVNFSSSSFLVNFSGFNCLILGSYLL